jgi:hypothetical protein
MAEMKSATQLLAEDRADRKYKDNRLAGEKKAREELLAAEADLELLKSGAVPIGGGWGENAIADAQKRVDAAWEAAEAYLRYRY